MERRRRRHLHAGHDRRSTSQHDPARRYETPDRQHFGRLANAFGKAAKVFFITADSLSYDFRRLDGIDFAFIDGAHDFRHVTSDTLNVLEVLRPGGWIVWHDFTSSVRWVEVRRALEHIRFEDQILHVTGTAVAFMRKAGRVVPVAPVGWVESSRPTIQCDAPGGSRRLDPPYDATADLSIIWEGTQQAVHSFAVVNRQMCSLLLVRSRCLRVGVGLPRIGGACAGWHVASTGLSRGRWRRRGVAVSAGGEFLPPAAEAGGSPCAAPVAAAVYSAGQGHWVFMQPWEYGSIPKGVGCALAP